MKKTQLSDDSLLNLRGNSIYQGTIKVFLLALYGQFVSLLKMAEKKFYQYILKTVLVSGYKQLTVTSLMQTAATGAA